MYTRIGIVLILVSLCCAAAQDKQAFDQYGDPLPPGALARLGTIRLRHDAAITCQAVSPDGRWLATGGGRSVRLWNLATKEQTQVFTLQNGGRLISPSALAFSPDSRFLAALSSYAAGSVFVWNLQSGQLRYQSAGNLREDSGSPTAGEGPFLAVLNSGQQVLIRNYGERAIHQIDLESGKEIHSFSDGQNSLTALAISLDGATIAGGTDARQVVLWNVATGVELVRLPHAYPLVSVAFSTNGQTLSTLDQDLAPILWDVKTGKEKLRLPSRTRSVAVSFGPKDESLIVARQPDQLIVWDLATRKEKTVSLPRGWVSSAAVPLRSFSTSAASETHADDILLGVIPRRTYSARVRLVTLADSHPTIRFDGYDNGSVFPFYLAKHQAWATIGTEGDDQLRLWDTKGRIAQAYSLPIGDQHLRCYALAPDGSTFVLGCFHGRMIIVNGSSGKALREIQAFSKACFDTEISSDGEDVIATDLREVKVYDLRSGKLRTSYEIRDKYIMRVLISGDGSRVAAQVYQDDDQPVLRLYEARTGKVIQETRPSINTTTYFFSSDGRSLIYLGNRGTRSAHITVVECATGKVRLLCDLPSPYQYIGVPSPYQSSSMHARISPDGHWLFATASGAEADQYAAVGWRLGTKDDPIILSGHRGGLVSVNYSTDAKQLLTLSEDSTMLTWDLRRYDPPTEAPKNESALQTLWQQLADRDAATAYRAIHELARQRQSAGWIASQITNQFRAAEPEHVAELVERLDAPKFEDRERATQTLIRMGSAVLPAVRSALDNASSAETKRRLQRILDQAQESLSVGGIELQLSRAIEALEIMGTDTALSELRKLAGRNHPIGVESRLAALRLGNRLALSQSSVEEGKPRSER